MAKIVNVATIRPKYEYDTKDIVEYVDRAWLSHIDSHMRKAAIRIFEGSEIERRGSVVPLDVIFGQKTFEEKNNLYKQSVIEMGEVVLKKALTEVGWDSAELDYLITTSCTGFMIPSVDAYLIQRLKLRQNIFRMPITEMGCAGGTSALIYAHEFARANPEKKIGILALETPSLTFQPGDVSMENFVSTAIFADGAACVLLGPTDQLAPQIVDTDMYHFPDSLHFMGYNLENSGLKIVLDRVVPDQINRHFEPLFLPFLKRNHLSPEQILAYMFHPGGKKIIRLVEDYIGRFGKEISESKNVLRLMGNMSSATILHILEMKLKSTFREGDYGYMLAFGPGFVAQSLLLKWQK